MVVAVVEFAMGSTGWGCFQRGCHPQGIVAMMVVVVVVERAVWSLGRGLAPSLALVDSCAVAL